MNTSITEFYQTIEYYTKYNTTFLNSPPPLKQFFFITALHFVSVTEDLYEWIIPLSIFHDILDFENLAKTRKYY